MRLVFRITKNLPVILLAGAVLLLALAHVYSFPPYEAAILAVLGVALFLGQAYRSWKRRRLSANLKTRWGKEDERDRDFEALGDQYETYRANDGAADSLDSATWVDLNMDEIYGKIDRTRTSAGELMLYVMLRGIVQSRDALEARSRAIKRLAEDTPLRDAILIRLDRLGRDSFADVAGLLWGGKRTSLRWGWVYNVFAGSAALSLLAFIPLGLDALMYVIPIFFINGLLTMVIVRGDVLAQLRTLRYTAKVIAAARDLAALDRTDLSPWTVDMGRAARATEGIARRIRLLNPEAGLSAELFDAFAYYVSVFFLVEIRTFNRVMGDVRRLGDDLRTVVRLVGELDALQSVASFRAGLARYCEPEFTNGSPALNIEGGRHPLLPAPVPNSVRSDGEDLFITGSNMAGKSTFLRMMALNVVLAQTIYTCCAVKYRATFFRLTSSMSHIDEIMSGTSFFLAEARRLLHVLQCAEADGMPFLCIIDEMLRGTNSVERHAASLAILRRLAHAPAVIIVASHDTELGQMLEEQYHLYHFSESFKEDRMEFDYRMKPGVCGAGNAIRTLDYIGFPDDVITDARAHLAHIQVSGGIYRTPPGATTGSAAS